jgi:hypothetical protein
MVGSLATRRESCWLISMNQLRGHQIHEQQLCYITIRKYDFTSHTLLNTHSATAVVGFLGA